MARKKSLVPVKDVKARRKRDTCLSKRRNGLFKKASDLSIMCGAEFAIIVFSATGTPFSFGNPSVHAVLDRYLPPSPDEPSSSAQAFDVDAHRENAVVSELKRQYDEVASNIEAEKMRRDLLEQDRRRRERENPFWRKKVDDLGLEELRVYYSRLAALSDVLADMQRGNPVPPTLEIPLDINSVHPINSFFELPFGTNGAHPVMNAHFFDNGETNILPITTAEPPLGVNGAHPFDNETNILGPPPPTLNNVEQLFWHPPEDNPFAWDYNNEAANETSLPPLDPALVFNNNSNEVPIWSPFSEAHHSASTLHLSYNSAVAGPPLADPVQLGLEHAVVGNNYRSETLPDSGFTGHNGPFGDPLDDFNFNDFGGAF